MLDLLFHSWTDEGAFRHNVSSWIDVIWERVERIREVAKERLRVTVMEKSFTFYWI